MCVGQERKRVVTSRSTRPWNRGVSQARYMQTLLAVDESLDPRLSTLYVKESARLALIIYSRRQRYSFGEHGLD